jgi:hypothetical protein
LVSNILKHLKEGLINQNETLSLSGLSLSLVEILRKDSKALLVNQGEKLQVSIQTIISVLQVTALAGEQDLLQNNVIARLLDTMSCLKVIDPADEFSKDVGVVYSLLFR